MTSPEARGKQNRQTGVICGEEESETSLYDKLVILLKRIKIFNYLTKRVSVANLKHYILLKYFLYDQSHGGRGRGFTKTP